MSRSTRPSRVAPPSCGRSEPCPPRCWSRGPARPDGPGMGWMHRLSVRGPVRWRPQSGVKRARAVHPRGPEVGSTCRQEQSGRVNRPARKSRTRLPADRCSTRVGRGSRRCSCWPAGPSAWAAPTTRTRPSGSSCSRSRGSTPWATPWTACSRWRWPSTTAGCSRPPGPKHSATGWWRPWSARPTAAPRHLRSPLPSPPRPFPWLRSRPSSSRRRRSSHRRRFPRPWSPGRRRSVPSPRRCRVPPPDRLPPPALHRPVPRCRRRSPRRGPCRPRSILDPSLHPGSRARPPMHRW